MGCCNPNYRKVVEEKEKKLNEQYAEKEISPWIKGISILTSITLIVMALYMSFT
ncbi:hypothetical protein [Bacillus kexueae]|uniref:hypothetical protein n=1 Tax=Aeribacillus kexueae TaxID=2078952 RepID=UPI001FAED333|nr:hypothetical protein [Bacillus kexueae]